MSKHDPLATLRQIEENALRVQEICAGKTLDGLLSDWQATLAFERLLEIVGEAVKRLSEEVRARYPQVQWKAIAGMRDRLSHGYDAIDYGILWKTVHERVPDLIDTVRKMIRDHEIDRG